MTTLVLPAPLARQIEREGASAYPGECCGAMIGKDVPDAGGTRRMVQRLAPMANSFASDEQYHRFSVDPLDLMRVEKSASSEGLAVLGFYHSHPDHPARPSEYDRQYAWPYYSYVIVSIAKGQAVDMTSWQLDEASATFSREEILELEQETVT